MPEQKREKGEKKPVNHNRKRSNTLSALKRKNIKTANQMSDYLINSHLPKEQETHMKKLRKELYRCANLTLYRDQGTEGMKLISSFFCGSKLCMVCNQNRQKSTRRKYWKWFDQNQYLVAIRKDKKQKTVTNSQLHKYADWMVTGHPGYDLMHLTLTVPHTAEHGFCGERYYFSHIQELYWLMRKHPLWNELVYGGEYGIETTKNDSGLHSHIHSLLLVKHTTQNRNRLHQFILKEWNKLTVNPFSPRVEITPQVAQLIMKGNKLIDQKFVSQLKPKGATLINLETIYTINREDGQKVRSTEFNSTKMLIAVMEAISYHFEPQAFDKENGEFNFDLMAEIMPKIYRQPLYKKFGCLHGETKLNIANPADESIVDEYQEIAENVNLETGEVLNDAAYFICNPAFVYHLPEKDLEPVLNATGKRTCVTLDAMTTREALHQMSEIFKNERNPRNTNNQFINPLIKQS